MLLVQVIMQDRTCEYAIVGSELTDTACPVRMHDVIIN
jgi:hypothetical protein